LETLVNTSKVMPMTGGLMVEKKKISELLDQLRLAVPQEVRAAAEVLAHKDTIISSAVSEARRNKAKAEEEFRERLNQNELKKRGEEILREAEQRAARMVQQAEADSRSRRLEADVYALRSLQALERQLSELGGSVRKGIDLLAASASVSANVAHGAKGNSAAAQQRLEQAAAR
jgi:triphosphoribosyl-dephospho-CoA synthetase